MWRMTICSGKGETLRPEDSHHAFPDEEEGGKQEHRLVVLCGEKPPGDYPSGTHADGDRQAAGP